MPLPAPTAFAHQTVLLEQAVAALDLQGERRDGVYIDGTFGRGGHSRLILQHLSAAGRLLVFDKDPEAIAAAHALQDPRLVIVHDSFANLTAHLARAQIAAVDGVLLDLGISSPQVDDAARGFSFRQEGPLDMRMDPTRGRSAAEWLAQAEEEQIREVIKNYGEERFAFQIAKTIVARRQAEPITGTRQLAELVAHAVKTREKGKDPATRTFQAIRIFINAELEDLQIGLDAACAALRPGGRLSVISFHSLEDRMVKQFMAGKARVTLPDRRLPIRDADLPKPQLRLINRVKPEEAEVLANPRARSAVLRVAERMDSGEGACA